MRAKCQDPRPQSEGGSRSTRIANSAVGSKGDSYDFLRSGAASHALDETIIGLFNTEVTHHQGPWRGFEEVEFGTLNWVWSFNHHRLLELIGYIPPVGYEEAYWRHSCSQVSGKPGAIQGLPWRRTG